VRPPPASLLASRRAASNALRCLLRDECRLGTVVQQQRRLSKCPASRSILQSTAAKMFPQTTEHFQCTSTEHFLSVQHTFHLCEGQRPATVHLLRAHSPALLGKQTAMPPCSTAQCRPCKCRANLQGRPSPDRHLRPPSNPMDVLQPHPCSAGSNSERAHNRHARRAQLSTQPKPALPARRPKAAGQAARAAAAGAGQAAAKP